MNPSSKRLRAASKNPRSAVRLTRIPIIAVLHLACVLVFSACSTALPDSSVHQSSVLLQGRFASRTITLEIADDPAEQAQGLMDRTTLAPDHGMLFVYADEAERSFWMHNTHISLDMIFLDAGRNIVGIIRRAKPDSDEVLSVKKPSRYVIEVEAGLCDRLGIREGDQLNFR